MTVEELMEVLSRCDKHKPVVLVASAEDATVGYHRKVAHEFNINLVSALSPQSISNPVKLFIGNPA